MNDTQLAEFDQECLGFIAGPHSWFSNPAVIDIDASPEVVCRAYVEFTWKKGGGLALPQVFRDGNEHGEGLVRSPGYGLLEQIMRVDPGRIVEYTIPRGPLPIRSHKGVVNFESINDGRGTRVTWVVHYTPTWYGYWFGVYCQKGLFAFFLTQLKDYVQKPKL